MSILRHFHFFHLNPSKTILFSIEVFVLEENSHFRCSGSYEVTMTYLELFPAVSFDNLLRWNFPKLSVMNNHVIGIFLIS